MEKEKQIIGKYQNGNYEVLLFTDGSKIRYMEEFKEFKPEFPESIDVNFTEKCNQKCPYCYLGCMTTGKHSDILEQEWINTLKPYTEIAINGNDMDHPDLRFFLLKMKKQNVIVNLTVNQNQFINNFELINFLSKEGLIQGLGISLISYNQQLENKINEYNKPENIVFHIINGLFDKEELDKIKGKNYKILILGYKSVNRGVIYEIAYSNRIFDNEDWLKKYLKENINKTNDFQTISFDNLALEQLDIKSIVDPISWSLYYMGDDGKYSMYIDAVNHKFAKNSTSKERKIIDENNNDILIMFKTINNENTD